MKTFSIECHLLLNALQKIGGVVERKQSMPILANALFVFHEECLKILGTDLELEMSVQVPFEQSAPEENFTVNVRKLIDICKALPQNEILNFEYKKNRLAVKTHSSQFNLVTLPANDFPYFEAMEHKVEFPFSGAQLKNLINNVYFCMAQQDVRYYLNGILLELKPDGLCAVATDGHRLALKELKCDLGIEYRQIILPRKAAGELQRLLSAHDETVQIGISENHISVTGNGYQFSSKLIDGRYPDYQGAIPKPKGEAIIINKNLFKQSLQRAAILANEKMHAIKFILRKNKLILVANNPEQEEAHEELEINYSGSELTVGFNVNYFIDVIQMIDSEDFTFQFSDNDSVLVEVEDGSGLFVIMPMHI